MTSHDAKVVRNQNHRHVEFFAKRCEKAENLGLNSDVQCRCRFIGKKNFWTAGERNCDHHALSHATRQLRWELLQCFLGLRDLNQCQQLNGVLLRCFLGHSESNSWPFGDLCSYATYRVECGHGILKNDRHFCAPFRPEFFTSQFSENIIF